MKIKLLIMLIAAASCVKKRPVERHQDFDDYRWPKSVLQTEKPWLYRVTVVNNGLNSTFGFVGLQSTPRLGHFEITDSQLKFVELKDNYTDSNNTDKVINAWKITHTDIHRKVINGRKSNVETENDEIPWNEKRFFKVDWTSAEITERSTFPYGIDTRCAKPLSTKLVEGQQEVTADHIGFVLAVNYLLDEQCIDNRAYFNNDFTLTIHYMYSFMPEPDNKEYQPYVYTGEDDPLMDKYGYFNTTTLNYDENRRPFNTFYMNRWNPEKQHTFYFSETFPSEYKWIYNDPERGVFARTNQLFAEQGLPTRFEIKENDGSKKFGDIRYSFVHFVDSPDMGAPFGYGPSTANPRTGEIISAHSVIWTHDVKAYLQQLRDTATRNTGTENNSSLYTKITETINQAHSEWSTSSDFLVEREQAEAFRYILPEFTYELPGSSFAGHEAPLHFDSIERALRDSALQQNPTNEWAQLLKQVQETTSTANNMYLTREYYNNPTGIAARTDLSDQFFAGFDRVDLSEGERVIDDILYQVAIHEFGHNLNLRHNFYGTVDAKLDHHHDNTINTNSHSVMDYLRLKDELGQEYNWGAYDRAALLYAYSAGRIDPAKDRVAPYLFCTDHHTIFNPLCNRFDSGATPSEIVKSQIEAYDEGYWFRNFRYNRAFWQPYRSYDASMFQTMFTMKKMIRLYEQAFLANDVQQILDRYPILSSTAPEEFVSNLRADLNQAVKLVLSFYKSVIQQSAVDRPFTDSFNPASGSLTQLGIASDKIYASMFMLGDDGFPLDPNRGVTPASILSLGDNDPELRDFVDEIVSDIFINGGDMYAGFTDIIRFFYASTASRSYELSGDITELQPFRVTCFTLESFANRFNIPLATIGQSPFEIGSFNQTMNPEFQGETSIVVLRVGDIILAAGEQLNPLSAAVLRNDDKSGGRNLGALYQRIVYNRQSLTCE
ncbi:MAG: zinc-dependent metalloprotease [Oligoflexus sp.]